MLNSKFYREGGGYLTLFSTVIFAVQNLEGGYPILLGWLNCKIDIHVRFSKTMAVVSGFWKPSFSNASTMGLWLHVNP